MRQRKLRTRVGREAASGLVAFMREQRRRCSRAASASERRALAWRTKDELAEATWTPPVETFPVRGRERDGE